MLNKLQVKNEINIMRPEKEITPAGFLESVSERVKLKEGREGVRRIFQEVYRSRKIGTKKLAYLTKLPIPVTAAVRRELEKEGMLARKGGAVLTEKGEAFVKEQLGLAYTQRQTCPACQGKGVEIKDLFKPMLEKLREYMARRPRAVTWLDQTHGTAETALLRALFMLDRGSVEGRRIIFLGDDDFTSIAVGLLKAAKEITVVDIDPRLTRTIDEISKQDCLGIDCVEHDLKEMLPKHLVSRFDVVFTDPPYTLPGLALFVSRGLSALRRRKGASVYLAYAHQAPKEMLKVQKTLIKMGLYIVEYIPRFNNYEGAEMFANTTSIMRLETTGEVRPLITGSFVDKFYTGEINETWRIYRCSCGRQIKVGSAEKIRTVEELKRIGCPKCSKKRGFKLLKKRKLKDRSPQRLRLRGFKKDDYASILEFEMEIAVKSFPEAPILSEDYHKQKLERTVMKAPDSLKVAVLNDEVVGWLWLRTERDRSTNERFGYIKSIIVKPQYRHQGLGRRLLEAAEEYFLNLGIDRVDLIVSETNYGATLFFEDAGFQRKHSTMRKRINVR